MMQFFVRGLALFVALALTHVAKAAEPNNTPTTATLLSTGQMVVSDSLDGRAGRPNTLLGYFGGSLSTLVSSNDNGSPLGNGFASQILGIPMRPDGSAIFKVTGATDTTFVGNHNQDGKYAWILDVRDPLGNLVPSLTESQSDELSPFNLDTIWRAPSASPDPFYPNWEGYTIDMTINNVVGPGTGDPLDFFVFSGLQPFQSFTATLSSNFAGLIGLYDAANTRIATSNMFDVVPTLVGTADFLGRVKIGVTGIDDWNFTGAHVAHGNYTLQLAIVPEPASVVMLGMGAVLAGLWRLGRGRRGNQANC